MPSITADKPEITIALVKSLIAEQFPKWVHLQIKPVELNGWDNRTFHLGKDMSIRLPSAEGYALQVEKEQKWLPILASHLSFPIPEPLAMGQPSKSYPWSWSVYRWIEGESANTLVVDALQALASDLAQFLNELHQINIEGGPCAGLHNYWRGGDLLVYDTEARTAIAKLETIINVKSALSVWERGLSSKWNKSPVWVHGDFVSGNILIKDNRLAAVIDFGCMGVGDPACDLAIAWTFLTNESRKVFRSHLCLDPDTWDRARGWVLWKACIELVRSENKANPAAMVHRKIISEILKENG